MAKKETPPQPQGKGSSSVNINTFTKGMNKDVAPSFEGQQAWWHARNAANNSEDGDIGMIGNEPSNLSCGVIPYTVIGAIHRYGDEWIVFSTDNVSSEIGRFDDSECKYTTLVNDPCLNFTKKHLITGAAKENFDCTWEVYWDDANNPSRALNIDDIPWKKVQITGPDIDGDPCVRYEIIEPKKLDCQEIRLAPLVDTPCIELDKATDGGMLRNGTYQAFIAYVENEQKVTDYIGISNLQSLFSHQGSDSSLNIKVSNLDQDYYYYELVLLMRNQGQTLAKRIGLYSTEQSDINIDFIDPALPAIDLKLIPLRSPAYEKSESMFVVNDWLIRQGPTEQFDFNYQPIANQIQTNWVINSLSSKYYTLGGNKLGFMRDEQYAFFIRWIYNTGERSSSYHIPGRAPENYNGTMENEIVFGDNVLNTDGEPLFKVYNTATATNLNLNEPQEDNSLVIARGKMGYWESTELYPSNRPDIWGNLCGKPIRHHKMPDESIGGANSPLHISTTDGDNINLVGVEFTNIGRPKYNDGSYIENVVGYEILRGSRQGARSILAKGMFKNMRKYDIPDSENILGNSQGLYPNYPYNSLQHDVFFQDGTRNKTTENFCDQGDFTGSIGHYEPLKGFTKDVFSFHAPDLMFAKPFLNAYETKIYGNIHGKSAGRFTPSEDHPQFKLLRPAAASLAVVIGIGYALNAVQGTTNKKALPVQGLNPVYAPWFVGGFTNGGTVTGGFTAAPASIGGLAIGNAIWDILLDELIGGFVDFADIYAGGIISSAQLNVQGAANFVKTAVPGTQGGGIEEGTVYDKPEAAMPNLLRGVLGVSLAQKNIAIGGDEIIDLFYNMVSYYDFVLKYNSTGFFNNFAKINQNDIFRTKNNDSNYIGSSFQTFDGIKYKINNLFRPSTVAVSTEKELAIPTTVDYSRFALGGYVRTDGSVNDFQNSLIKDFSKAERQTSISALYGALKFNFDNQYGQLDGIKQIQMRGCVELLDNNLPPEALYTSKPIFSGDVSINRYTEKCIMPIFTNFLKGQPNGHAFDYSLYVNIPYPRFWLNSTKFDISNMAREVATLGLASGNWEDALPTGQYYLDRGSGNCQSTNLFGSLFGGSGGGGNLNPAFQMKRAYMYTHINGINEFFVESEVNLAYRDWEDSPDKRFYDAYEYNDLGVLFHADNIKADNFYKYDDSLSGSKFPTQMTSFGQVQPRDYDPYVSETCFVSYPKRLIYSLQAQEESKRDYWRVFLNNNYKDFKNEVSVIKPINKNGALIFFPYLSPQMFQGLDTLKTQLDTKLTIGDGGLFSQPFQNVANADLSNEYGSCESLRGVINTPLGLFFISQQQGKIFQYAGKGMDPISNNGMKWWFNKYLPSRFIKQFPSSENTQWTDNPVAGVGCQVMYDSVDDIVYFMKKDYQLKPDYIGQATFVDRPFKPVEIRGEARVPVSIDIGDPIYFDDCSWTVSYDPKSKAWISFHDWHPELALPSINHFFTTKTVTTTIPQCPPGYNFNPTTGLCEIGVNESLPAEVTIENIAATIGGGPVNCLVDVVISMDVSGSTNQFGRRAAQQTWLTAFLNDPQIQQFMSNSQMQIGFDVWDGGARVYTMPGGVTMSHTITEAQATAWFNANWTGGSTNVLLGLQTGNGILTNPANSTLGDRTSQPNYRAIQILITDTTSAPGNNVGQPFTSVGAGTAPAYQFVYAMYCGATSSTPPTPGVLNDISMSSGPVNVDPFQFGINASDPTTFQSVATAIAGAVCGTDFTCDCPAGYTKVFLDPVASTYTATSGACDDVTPPICRKVTCECPTSTVPGSTTTQTGTCPDTAPEIFLIGDPTWIDPTPLICNYFYFDSVTPNYNVGGFWRHNVRCDSFVNYYGEDYPWEIDLISNTGQSVNTVRSFEYQLETYVYKGDPQYNMCGGDKWEDLDFNFDASIIYNNDQTSGLLLLNPQPVNSPWTNLDFPTLQFNGIQILVSKVEHKFRFNQFWDVTNDRGEFTNAEQPIFDTSCNGYVRPLNYININYAKSATQRKKFRHYSNNVILRRNVSGNRKMLLRLNNTKLLLSQR